MADRPRVGMVSLVGAGPGDPGLITLKGVECLERCEVLVYDRLADPRLLERACPECERIYVGKEAGRHAFSQEEINALLIAKAEEGKRVVRLKGGDPFVFGRGGEEALALSEAGTPFEVVPGVTSAVAAAAYAGIPVTHRGVSSAFTVITGHEDPDKEEGSLDWGRLAQAPGTLVLLMGVGNLPGIASRLLSAGKPPETLLAIVEWGTTQRQETVVTTLGGVEETLRQKEIRPPVVTVIGEVVRLREQLRWFERRPLWGRRVLVTRARAQAGSLTAALEDLGAEAVELPSIRFLPPQDWCPLDEGIGRLEGYHWVVFTSANGVGYFFGRLRELGRDARALAACRIAAIGPATAQALEAHGLRPDLVPGEYVSEAVVEALVSQGAAGLRVLLPRAAEAREALAQGLRQGGALVDEVAAYRTVADESAGEEARTRLVKGEIDVVIFTSSSTVRNLASLLGGVSALAAVTVACIGPIAASTAEELGIRVDVVAREHTIPGLVQALVEHFGGNQ